MSEFETDKQWLSLSVDSFDNNVKVGSSFYKEK